MDSEAQDTTISPVIGRILIVNAVVHLVLSTILTSAVFSESLQLIPDQVATRPWTLFTAMLVHSSLGHLALTSLGLLVFGPAVERRLGPGIFFGYYLILGLGTSLFALVLARVGELPPVVGPWGVVVGMAVAYGSIYGNRAVPVFALPLTVQLRTLVWAMVGVVGFGALWFRSGGLFHLADMGAVIAAMTFLRLRGIVPAADDAEERPAPPVAAAPIRLRVEAASAERSSAAPRGGMEREGPEEEIAGPTPGEEINRVLDKISAEGMTSLTEAEQQFLRELSRRKREGSE